MICWISLVDLVNYQDLTNLLLLYLWFHQKWHMKYKCILTDRAIWVRLVYDGLI